MNANQVYALPAIQQTWPHQVIEWLGRTSIFPLADAGVHEFDPEKVPDLEGKLHGYYNCDGERTWLFASLWFRGTPFMVLQLSGRGGREYVDADTTDLNTWKDAFHYILTQHPHEGDNSGVNVVNPEHEQNYGNFYGLTYERLKEHTNNWKDTYGVSRTKGME